MKNTNGNLENFVSKKKIVKYAILVVVDLSFGIVKVLQIGQDDQQNKEDPEEDASKRGKNQNLQE